MSITKNQSDFSDINTVLNDIKERLLEKGNRHRDVALKEIDAHARGYLLGVFDTLEMVEAAEQQAQNAPRTNLDRIRAMSAEEIADWVAGNLECDSCPLNAALNAVRVCGETNCAATFVKWLNSPAKEGGKNG